MPMSDFECEKCHHTFEENVRLGDPATCPKCGAAECTRLMGAPMRVGVAPLSFKTPGAQANGRPKRS
ncbi:MAG: zinc ribbon domain-containing protein [Kofleriaceae bacterium]|nr:zinc ribbon domain-containing protein [Kofleriaceae bacterium]MBP6840041.1 zinc ribbon domain-containing protein [Kofleriaceae bacterium]